MGSFHSYDTEMNLCKQFPCLYAPHSHFISRAAPQPPEIFPASIFLVLILSFLMVYPSGYHRDTISNCLSRERRGKKKKSAKVRLGYLCFLSSLWLKSSLSFRCGGMVMLWMSSRLWWKWGTVFIVSQRCSYWICLISSASSFHSCISSARRLCLWLLHSLFWTLWFALSWRRSKNNCPARVQTERRFAVYQALH